MRLFTLISFIFLHVLRFSAQSHGNDWIQYAQKYYKFPIYKEGIYRIDSTTLAEVFNLNLIDPRNFQLFIKGKEHYLSAVGEGDGKVNNSDYLEFYADNSMGDIDSTVYSHIRYNPNPFAPLFNDTIYGYLTLNTSFNNKRFSNETDTNSVVYPAADHFYTQQVFNLPVNYNFVEEYIQDVACDPRYTQAEGRGLYFTGNSPLNMGLIPANIYTNSPLPVKVDLCFSGCSKNFNASGSDHELRLMYKDALGNPTLLFDTLFYGFAPVRKTFNLNTQNIQAQSNFTLTSILSAAITASNNASMLHYLQMFYPQTLNLNGASYFKFYADNAITSSKAFYKFTNFNPGTSASVMLYDLTNGKKITTVITPGNLRAVIPNGSGRKFCVLAAEMDTISVKKLLPVNQSGNFTKFNSNAVSKPFVLIYHRSLQSSATAYSNYRKSIAGGAYDVIMADIQELYEQFAYGVNKHPAAIRSFLKFLNDSLNSAPQFVLLIGKGINQQYLLPSTQNENLIPTLGIPSSDHLLSASIKAGSTGYFVPDVPIGRLAAISNSEVSQYLAKVQQHESSAPAEWKKNMLHFIGSNDESELNTFSGFMESYSITASDTSFGAGVSTFRKNTSAPIQINLNDSINRAMEKGAALINFFGHGATQNLGMAIEDPYKFNNQGRYPFFIANSCYSGNIFIHGVQNSVSQKYVFANQRGSIGYIATTSESFDSRLHQFTRKFYTSFCKTSYNKAIGEVIQEALQSNSTSPDSLTRFVGLQEILHGDPSVRIAPGNLPDFKITNSDVSFNTKTHADSIGIRIRTLNQGKAIEDSIAILTERFFPNGDTVKLYKQVKAPYFTDSLTFFMAIDFNRGIGLNKFRVTVDAGNQTNESDENNNSSDLLNLLIAGNDLSPVYPFNFAVVPMSQSITLKASTSDPFAPEGDYILQLDTNSGFLNPLYTKKIRSKGGVLEWNVLTVLKDSTVYFWRVSRDSTGPQNSFLWKLSSFQTIGTKRGWGQAHFDQFAGNSYRFLTRNTATRKFEFQRSVYSVFSRTGNVPQVAWENVNYYFNEIKMSEFSCAPNGWNFVVFDSLSAQPQASKVISFPVPSPGLYNNCMCAGYDLYYFSFGATNQCGLLNWKNDMENFINAIAPNNYVLGFSVGYLGNNAQVSTYSSSLLNAFKTLGADQVLTGPDSLPRIFFGRKGLSQGQAHETKGSTLSSLITQNDSIVVRSHSGTLTSEIIGPSSNWGSLHWRVKSLEISPGDTAYLKLIGIRKNGTEDTLWTFVQDSSDILSLNSYISASTHPYLKLVAFLKDKTHRTAPQIQRWQVLYDDVPECAINPLKGYNALNDTLMEGDDAKFVVPIQNISEKDFKDSLVITYWMEDAQLNKIPLPQKLKAAPFKAGQIIFDTLNLNSYKILGNNALWIYANPVDNLRYQYEMHQFNNLGRFPFTVLSDVTNPLLQVTFDGRRIMNGDLVSAKPEVLISLKDENKFLALNDTSAFEVYIQKPAQSVPQRLAFGKELQFTPASLPKNSCSINYNPLFDSDGTYTLSVQAKDRSANLSGTNRYTILFEIKNKPSITNVLNYPNPFSTSTHFVFTLTGSDVPEVFTIQIMTISGKIVREITRAELGDLHVGRNITDFAWDGKDMYGDKLANGVYLYRVNIKLNGNDLEKYSSGADSYFTKEYGKMVLMR